MAPRITNAEFASTSFSAINLTDRQAQRINALEAHDQAIGGWLRQTATKLLRAVAEYPTRRRVYDELSVLSDRELMDIGLSRGDIPRVFAGEFEAREARAANAQGNVAIRSRSIAA